VPAALARIPVGARIVSSPGMGTPTTILDGLAEAATDRRWRLCSGLLTCGYPFLPAVEAGELGYDTWHVTGSIRGHVARGTIGFIPARASALAGLFRRWPAVAAVVRISPPAADGMCSLGPSVGYARAAIEAADVVIAEVDPALPRTCGDSLIDVSRFDSLVDSATPVSVYTSARPGGTSRAIAAKVIELLPPSPTLQVGIGGIPESFVRLLPGSGIGPVCFVGMATDDMVDLNARDLLRPSAGLRGHAILSPDMMGTDRLLEFGRENPVIGMYPSSLAHDPMRLGEIERFVSLNTALEVDLTGNVNSEVLAGQQVAGTGGSLDYIEAAGRSRGGLSIIALPAASADGSLSRIVPSVAAVTVPRTMVDTVVTEYGVARLAGSSLAERAEALISIARPGHRPALRVSLSEKAAT
jgi:4-hydroxybutyrate CoA-transferase